MQLFKFESEQPFSLIHVSEEVTHEMAEGLGFNWFSTYEAKTYPAPDDEKRWEKIFRYADWLNIQFVRFGQASGVMVDERGHFRASDHGSFDQLRRLDAWAKKKGVSLLIDPFGPPAAFRYAPWPGAPGHWGSSRVLTGVEDVEGFVRYFIVPYVRHVVETMGCESVKWFNFVNEPLTGGAFCTPPGVDNHVRYVECLAAIRKGLDEAGLSRIGNMGPDTNDLVYWPIPYMEKMGADPDPHIQAYCMHHYLSHFDWDRPANSHLAAEPISKMIARLERYKEHAGAKGKPFFMTEIGMMHYGWERGDPAGVARHDNFLLEAEFILRGLDKGIDGALRWAWLNPGDQDGWWQLIETKDGSDAPLISPFYGYGTLMRYIDRRARILKTALDYRGPAPQNVWATAVWNQDGSRTLYVVNDSYCDCKNITVRFPVNDVLYKIVNDHVHKHQKVGEIKIKPNAEFSDSLTPMSLTVYSTRHPSFGPPG